jgi:hypothetical protein
MPLPQTSNLCAVLNHGRNRSGKPWEMGETRDEEPLSSSLAGLSSVSVRNTRRLIFSSAIPVSNSL